MNSPVSDGEKVLRRTLIRVSLINKTGPKQRKFVRDLARDLGSPVLLGTSIPGEYSIDLQRSSETPAVPPWHSMNNLTNKSHDEIRNLLQASRQTLIHLYWEANIRK